MPETKNKADETIEAPNVETGEKPDQELAEKRSRLIMGDEVAPPPPKKRGRGRPRGTTKALSSKDVKSRLPEDEIIGWSMLTETFGAVVGIACRALWPTMPVTPGDEKAVTRAWAVYFTACPPESLEDLAKLNLVCVHLVILLPRMAFSLQAWFARRAAAGKDDAKPTKETPKNEAAESGRDQAKA